MKKVLWLTAIVAVAVATSCSTASPDARPAKSDGPGLSTGTMDDWTTSVCKLGRYRGMGEFPVPHWICNGNPVGGGFGTLLFIFQFRSEGDMRVHPELWSGRYSYASCASGNGGLVVFVSDVSGIGSNDLAIQLTSQSLQPLTEFGCTITAATPNQSAPTVRKTSLPQPAPLTPAWTSASPVPPSTQPSLPDADEHGFLNFPGARCNYTNPAVAIGRTADSAVVICETGAGRFYYKGFGFQNGQSVEIDDPVHTGSAFIATNNGVQYSVSPTDLIITQGSTTLSNEPMLEYWSA